MSSLTFVKSNFLRASKYYSPGVRSIWSSLSST